MHRRRGLVAAGLVAFVLGSACAEPNPLPPIAACEELVWPTPDAALNVVVILTDTTRRDRVGAYGGSAHTPHFDAFAETGQLFEHAYSQAPWTKPSIATLFTSLHPSQHGLVTHPRNRPRNPQPQPAALRKTDVLPDELTTLAEAFAASGYRTAAFVSNPWLDHRFGLAQGFDHYEDAFQTAGKSGWESSGSDVNAAALRWLQGLRPGERYFLYLHYVDNHRPHPPLRWKDITAHVEAIRGDDRALSADARDEIRAAARMEREIPAIAHGLTPSPTLMGLAYDRGVEAFDTALGSWLAGFSAHWSARDTLTIVTSDHGEALFERGYGNHGHSLFEEEIAVPLAIQVPDGPVGRSSCPVGLIDLMPTLCDYLDLECPDAMYGQSLLPGQAVQRDPRYLVSEGVVSKPGQRAITDGRHKLIYKPRSRRDPRARFYLYDLASDPLEQNNLLDAKGGGSAAHFSSPDDPDWLKELARRVVAAVPVFDSPELETVTIDPELEEQLRHLGYIPEAPEPDLPGSSHDLSSDPRDRAP